MQFDILRIVDSGQQQIRQGIVLFGRSKPNSGQIALMIVINHQNFFAVLMQGRSKVYHTGCLTDTAFLFVTDIILFAITFYLIKIFRFDVWSIF